MTRRLPMYGLAFRLLLAAACVLPFTGVAAAAPVLSLAPAGDAPVNEEDGREEEEAGEARAANVHDEQRVDPLGTSALLPVLRSIVPSRSGPTRSTAADPFCNGLGTPFRC